MDGTHNYAAIKDEDLQWLKDQIHDFHEIMDDTTRSDWFEADDIAADVLEKVESIIEQGIHNEAAYKDGISWELSEIAKKCGVASRDCNSVEVVDKILASVERLKEDSRKLKQANSGPLKWAINGWKENLHENVPSQVYSLTAQRGSEAFSVVRDNNQWKVTFSPLAMAKPSLEQTVLGSCKNLSDALGLAERYVNPFDENDIDVHISQQENSVDRNQIVDLTKSTRDQAR